MEKSELTKQFQVTLFEKDILITTPSNNIEAYEAKINYQTDTRMLLVDKYGVRYGSIDTGDMDLNYYECCGVLILFGITPPSFEELYKLLE